MTTHRLILFFIVSSVTLIDGRYFRNDYSYVAAAEGWVKLHLIPETWDNARLRCLLEGSVLATPTKDHILTTMRKTMGQTVKTIFTGVSATYSEGDFYSVEGIPFEKIPKCWAPGEPNNSGDENCISMGANGSLADVSCVDLLPYICYKKNTQEIPSTNQCGTVDPGYVLDTRTGHCYKFHRFGQAWPKAFMTCSAEGGYLAVINSDVEAKVLVELMAKFPTPQIQAKHKDIIGIGYHDWSQHGVFMTVHGQTLTEAGYDKWSTGQPDNATTGEYCGTIYRNSLLNDICCGDAIPFICEKLPGSLLDNETSSTDKIPVNLQAQRK